MDFKVKLDPKCCEGVNKSPELFMWMGHMWDPQVAKSGSVCTWIFFFRVLHCLIDSTTSDAAEGMLQGINLGDLPYHHPIRSFFKNKTSLLSPTYMSFKSSTEFVIPMFPGLYSLHLWSTYKGRTIEALLFVKQMSDGSSFAVRMQARNKVPN